MLVLVIFHWHGTSDDFGQLQCGGDGCRCTRSHDGSSNTASVFFLTVLPQHIGKVLLCDGRNPMHGVGSLGCVHTHIKPALPDEAKPSLRCIELRRRYTEVE